MTRRCDHSEQVRYCSCHENIKFISSSKRVMFFYYRYINILITTFLMIFRRFPTTFRRFPKDFPKLFRRPEKHFQHFPRISKNFRTCRRFPKIAEDFWGRPKDVPIITNEFKYNLRDKLDISEVIDIFTYEDIVLFSSICYHSVYHWVLYNKHDCYIAGIFFPLQRAHSLASSWSHDI